MAIQNALLNRAADEMLAVIDGVKAKGMPLDEAHAIVRAGAVLVKAIETDIEERRLLLQGAKIAQLVETPAKEAA